MPPPQLLILAPKGEERKWHRIWGQIDQSPCCSLTGLTYVPQADYITSLSLSFSCWPVKSNATYPTQMRKRRDDGDQGSGSWR